MSRKNGARNRVANSADGGVRQVIERLIEKQRIKEAFKQAKVCFRQDGSADNRRLLERIYLLRVQELVRGGLLSAAEEVARNFLEFGVTDASLLPDLVLLLPTLGMASQAVSLSGRLDTPEAQSGLTAKLADRAVIRPDQAPPSNPAVREGAQRIRSALAAVDEGNEVLAGELLKDIPRNSPWADWRYFARGLAALRRGEMEQAFAAWDRLAPERLARRIAEQLKRAAAAPSSDRASADLSMIETAVFGESVLGRLGRLAALIGADPSKPADWNQALGVLGPLRKGLCRIDVRLAQRLTAVLLEPLRAEAMDRSWESGSRLVQEFTKVAEPLPFDPQWNRLWALLWEEADDSQEAIGFWRRYLDDLESAFTGDSANCRRLQAMVWRHIGRLWAEDADANWKDAYRYGPTKAELAAWRSYAVEALEQSLRLDPTQRGTHDLRISMLQYWKQVAAVARAAEDLLTAFPDDIDTIRLLIEHHARQDEPEIVLQYVERARALKPLDAGFLECERAALLALARHCALAGRWDEGRAAFERAAAAEGATRDFHVVARQAVFEFKAGQTERGYELVDEAISLLAEPTALWLLLAIEAVRYQLPDKLKASFERSLRKDLAKKTSGQTAGLMCQLLVSYQVRGVEYEGHEGHVRQVVAYLRRTSRTRYLRADVLKVCAFLGQLPKERKLLQTFVRRGVKAFPDSALMLQLAAEQELAKGPMNANLDRARKLLDKALAIARKSDDPVESKSVAVIKRGLLLLDDLLKKLEAEPFRGMPFFEQFLDGFDAEEDDEEDDEGPWHDQAGGPFPFFHAFGGGSPHAAGGSRKRK
jgi:hypothetical protein